MAGDGVQQIGDFADGFNGARGAGEFQAQSGFQVFRGAQDGGCRWRHDCEAGEQGVDGWLRLGQGGCAGGGDVEQLAGALGGAFHLGEVFEQGEGGVDDAGAGGVGAAGEVLDGFDDLVAVAGVFGDEVQHEEAQIAMFEKARHAAAAAVAGVRGVVVLRVGETAGAGVVGVVGMHNFCLLLD